MHYSLPTSGQVGEWPVSKQRPRKKKGNGSGSSSEDEEYIENRYTKKSSKPKRNADSQSKPGRKRGRHPKNNDDQAISKGEDQGISKG